VSKPFPSISFATVLRRVPAAEWPSIPVGTVVYVSSANGQFRGKVLRVTPTGRPSIRLPSGKVQAVSLRAGIFAIDVEAERAFKHREDLLRKLRNAADGIGRMFSMWNSNRAIPDFTPEEWAVLERAVEILTPKEVVP
jgi:hypothetical protein